MTGWVVVAVALVLSALAAGKTVWGGPRPPEESPEAVVTPLHLQVKRLEHQVKYLEDQVLMLMLRQREAGKTPGTQDATPEEWACGSARG